MSNKILSKQTISLVPNQKRMDMPKVKGYILGINVKLFTNEQTIYTNEYNMTIHQFPYSEGYFKMRYDESQKNFMFESIYRIDLEGHDIMQRFNKNSITANIVIKGCLNIEEKNNKPEIDSIELIHINHDKDQDLHESFNSAFINNEEILDLLEEYQFYDAYIISRY